MERILVLGSNNNAALAVTQDLGEDYEVYSFGFREDFNKVNYSKFLKESKEVSKYLSLSELKSEIVDFVDQNKISCLIPTNDRFTLLAGEPDFREWIPGVLITTPEDTQLKRGMGKSYMAAMASKHGIRVPKTYDKGGKMVFPLLLKSKYSWEIQGGEFIRGGVYCVQNEEELSSLLPKKISNRYFLQERVSGVGWGLEILAKNGQVFLHFAHARIRESDPAGGYSSAAVSIKPNPFYLEAIKGVISYLNWTGVAMFEFKGDYTEKNSYFIEMNCRFWGSLPVALHSRCRFPYLMMQMFQGHKIVQPYYREGTKVRWWQADLIHFLKLCRLKVLRKAKGLPSLVPSFRGVFLERMKSYNVYKGDWKPGFFELTLGSIKKL